MFVEFLSRPEYVALIVSVIAIIVNVYISQKNRKHMFAKEEYFKLQQIAEKIISKLIILDNHREKFKVFFQLSFHAQQNKNSVFVDLNDTLNKADFDQKGEEVAAYIDIYFPNLGADWNFCLDKMNRLHTQIFMLSQKTHDGQDIDL